MQCASAICEQLDIQNTCDDQIAEKIASKKLVGEHKERRKLVECTAEERRKNGTKSLNLHVLSN